MSLSQPQSVSRHDWRRAMRQPWTGGPGNGVAIVQVLLDVGMR